MSQSSPELFCAACRVRGPLVLESERPGQRGALRHTLSLPFALVGRDPRADLHLDYPRIRSLHVYLQVVSGQLWSLDLSSASATAAPLQRGQRIALPPFTVRLAESGWSEDGPASLVSPLARESYDASVLPQARLDFREGTERETLWMVTRVLTLVGRGALCKLRLHNPSVSPIHCALLHTPEGLWVVDLLSREGVRVNGTAVRWALLEDNDELRIGPFLACVRVRPAKRALVATSRFEPSPRSPNAWLPSTQTVVSPAPLEGPLPADLEGLLSALPATATVGGESGTLLLPLIRQFALMQQQMFDQFQQALLTMAQMFSGLHREQLQLIRQELTQLSEVTRELQSLQAQNSRPKPAAEEIETGSPAESRPDSLEEPVAPAVSNAAEKPATSPPPPPANAAAESAPAREEPAKRSTADVHLWLAQRLQTLQQERQSRWQRILSILTGK